MHFSRISLEVISWHIVTARFNYHLNLLALVLSTPLSPDNEWVQLAEVMPWKALDDAYQLEFTKNLGRAAKPFRMLYGAGLIQQRMGLTDRGVVAAIRDTPALQYFIGLSEYKAVAPFSYSSLAHFRKRIADISELITNIINDTVRAKIEALVPFKVDTVITDATAVPVKSSIRKILCCSIRLGSILKRWQSIWHTNWVCRTHACINVKPNTVGRRFRAIQSNNAAAFISRSKHNCNTFVAICATSTSS